MLMTRVITAALQLSHITQPIVSIRMQNSKALYDHHHISSQSSSRQYKECKQCCSWQRQQGLTENALCCTHTIRIQVGRAFPLSAVQQEPR